MRTVTVDSDAEVGITFDHHLTDSVMYRLKCLKERFPDSARNDKFDKIKECLDFLEETIGDVEFIVEGHVDDVDVEDNEIQDAYDDMYPEGGYDEGYDAAMKAINANRRYYKQRYSLLLYKLDKLAYNYGNAEPLTQDELRVIRDLLGIEYTK